MLNFPDMKTISMDLRQRIVSAYDKGDATREAVAKRFGVSLGFVKKLLGQRKRIGTIESLYHRAGRKAKLEPEHGERLKNEVTRKRGRCAKGERLHASAPHGYWCTTTMISSIALR